MSASSKDNIWFAGAVVTSSGKQQPDFARWNGTEIVTAKGPDIEAEEVEVRGLAVSTNQDAWAVGYTTQQGRRQMLTMRWDGLKWSVVDTPGPTSEEKESAPAASTTRSYESSELTAVSVVAPDDVWAAGYYEVNGTDRTLTLHWDGNEWGLVDSPNSSTEDNRLSAIVSLAKGDTWAFGVAYDSSQGQKSLAIHWDGENWQVAGPPRLGLVSDAAIDKSKNIWAINGAYNAESWLASAVKGVGSDKWGLNTMPKVGYPILSSVSAQAQDDVWAVGYKWSGYSSGVRSDQVGARSLVMHWDGTSWTEVPGPDPSYIQQLFGVAALNKDEVWAVGTSSDSEDNPGSGLIAHFVGCSGSKYDPASTKP